MRKNPKVGEIWKMSELSWGRFCYVLILSVTDKLVQYMIIAHDVASRKGMITKEYSALGSSIKQHLHFGCGEAAVVMKALSLMAELLEQRSYFVNVF